MKVLDQILKIVNEIAAMFLAVVIAYLLAGFIGLWTAATVGALMGWLIHKAWVEFGLLMQQWADKYNDWGRSISKKITNSFDEYFLLYDKRQLQNLADEALWKGIKWPRHYCKNLKFLINKISRI